MNRPLPKGTRIRWNDMKAMVYKDYGGNRLRVIADSDPDHIIDWYWTYEGVTCEILSEVTETKFDKLELWKTEALARGYKTKLRTKTKKYKVHDALLDGFLIGHFHERIDIATEGMGIGLLRSPNAREEHYKFINAQK